VAGRRRLAQARRDVAERAIGLVGAVRGALALARRGDVFFDLGFDLVLGGVVGVRDVGRGGRGVATGGEAGEGDGNGRTSEEVQRKSHHHLVARTDSAPKVCLSARTPYLKEGT